ncbi:MAG: substrate-binding domain-containing protein [Eubacteriales bacterium]
MKWFKIERITGVVCIVAFLFFIIIGFLTMQQTKEEYQIVLIPKTIGATEFWVTFKEGGIMAASEYGVSLEIIGTDDETDEAGQIAIIEEILAREVLPDAMVISPLSYSSMTDMLREVEEKGIHLVLVDSIIDEDFADGVVATDNVLAGTELGKYAASLIDEGDQIVIVGHVENASTAIDREEGVREGLGEMEENIQEVVFCDSSYEKAQTLTVEMIEKYPDLKIIIGLNENAAVGAAWGLKQMEKEGEILLVGFDSSLEEVKLMEEGVFQGIVIQNPFNMGYLGVEQAVKLINKETIDNNIDSGSKLITMDNLYDEENQKLLFPFNTSVE